MSIIYNMEKLIYKIAIMKSQTYLVNKYSLAWYNQFSSLSWRILKEVCVAIPDIGPSIFSLNYKFAPSYIAWYKAMEKLKLPQDEMIKNIWVMNEKMMKVIPSFLLHRVGKIYFNSFRKKAKKHIQKQKAGKLHPYDWKIEYREIDHNSFEIDIKTCGIKKMAETYQAEGLLPSICRMDYLFASLMHTGFERTKTLGDGDDCCNCRYYLVGTCEWNPEKGFEHRK